MSLAIKYRPKSFNQIKGNEVTVSVLIKMLSNIETCPHSFLFHGPKGCGKTTFGRIIAKELDCVGSDFHEINTADMRGIDTAREIIKNVNFKPLEGSTRVYLIDECHKLTNDAQSALLKVLEEPPKSVYFILCTTDPDKLLKTVVDRCQQFQLKPLNNSQLSGLLRNIVRKEGEELDQKIIDQIVYNSYGHPRAAIAVLEKVLSSEPELREQASKDLDDEVSQGIELCRALLNKAKWKEVSRILKGLKDQEPEDLRRMVLGYCQSVLLSGEMNDQAAMIIETFAESIYYAGMPKLVFYCYSIVT